MTLTIIIIITMSLSNSTGIGARATTPIGTLTITSSKRICKMECKRISIQWFISIFIKNILDFRILLKTTISLFEEVYTSNFKKPKHQLSSFASFTIQKDIPKLIKSLKSWENNLYLKISD